MTVGRTARMHVVNASVIGNGLFAEYRGFPENVVSEVLAGAESCYVSRLRCETATLSRKLSPQASSLFFGTASLATYLSDASDVAVPQSQIAASPFQPKNHSSLLSGDRGGVIKLRSSKRSK